MVDTVEDEEKEHIKTLIQQNVTLPELQKRTKRSKSTIYRIANEFNLDIAKKEPESAQDKREAPYSESDKETYRAVKSFVKGHSRRHINAIIDAGQLLHHKYENTARELDMELSEFAEQAIDFFLEESVMVNAYKVAIKRQNEELQVLKSKLDTSNLMREHLKELSITLMMAGKKVDYESALASAKALATAVNQLEIGEFEYVHNGRQQQADRDGSRTGDIKEGAVEEVYGPEDTDATLDDSDGLESTPEPEHVRDDEGFDVLEDDGEDGGGRQPPSESRDSGAEGAGKGSD